MSPRRPTQSLALRVTLVVVTVTLAAALGLPTTALASLPGQQLRGRGTNLCLATTEGYVYAGACDRADKSERWHYRSYQLINVQTKQCLDSGAGGYVYAALCSGRTDQDWLLRNVKGTSAGVIWPMEGRGATCLDSQVPGYVYTIACLRGDATQRWDVPAGWITGYA